MASGGSQASIQQNVSILVLFRLWLCIDTPVQYYCTRCSADVTTVTKRWSLSQRAHNLSIRPETAGGHRPGRAQGNHQILRFSTRRAGTAHYGHGCLCPECSWTYVLAKCINALLNWAFKKKSNMIGMASKEDGVSSCSLYALDVEKNRDQIPPYAMISTPWI